jgi:hypothetical protein
VLFARIRYRHRLRFDRRYAALALLVMAVLLAEGWAWSSYQKQMAGAAMSPQASGSSPSERHYHSQ